MNTTYGILLFLALLGANLPWFSERLFGFLPVREKHIGWRLLELAVFYFMAGGLVWLTERETAGQIAPQHWEFYAVTVFLFLVFSFPGFVYRYLWRR